MIAADQLPAQSATWGGYPRRGRPLLGRKLHGQSKQEPRDLGPLVEDKEGSA
jgi:hypothetical protein